MSLKPKKQHLGQLAFNLLLTLVTVQSSVANVSNHTASGQSTLLSEVLEVLEYEPPPRGAPGGNIEDAGSRSPCDLVPIVPRNRYGLYGLTAAEYPTFWFYVKHQSSLSKSVQFELQDEKRNVVYKTTLELTQREGVMSLSLPQTAPPLKTGQRYQWVISYNEINNEMYAGAQIERVALPPELESQLKQATLRERLRLFAKERLWYDTVTELSQLRRSSPQDAELDVAWSAVLNLIPSLCKDVLDKNLDFSD